MKKKLRVFCSLLLAVQMILSMVAVPVFADDDNVVTPEEYKQLESPSAVYNMNIDWKFKKAGSGSEYPLAKATASVTDANGKQFYEVGYDDSAWDTVSIPHPINAEDSFDGNCYDAGEAGLYRGFMFYRKNIDIPASDAGKKLFLEFEAFRQSVYVYVNGEIVGFYEAGVAPVGFDITDYVVYGESNLIAIATDNASDRGQSDRTKITAETRYGSEPGAADGYGYQWNTKDFNEVQGGITGNVNLYAKGHVYQTLPLYNNLKTTGNYIYGSNYDIDDKTATINVEAEVRNETSEDVALTLQVDVVDMETGALAYTFEQEGTAVAATDKDAHFMSLVPEDAYAHESGAEPAPTDTSTVDVSYIKASFDATDMKFWSDKTPYLYTVYTYLKDGAGNIIDAQKTVTGFRKVEYDINDGGLKINDVSTYLKGYAQRSTNEWAVVGVANDWLSDIDMMLLKESNGNHIRWMHIAPNPVDIRAGDKYGVISTVPAGDKEGDVSDRAWDQRVEAMRDVMIYFRNSPSVFFWEAGNANISAAHMQEMTDLRKVLDPNGGRFAGSRTISAVDQIQAAEYVGTMLNRNASAAKNSMTSAGNKYMPITETEYARDEAPRRVWDDFSPPDFDYVNRFSGGTKKDGLDVWDQTSEDFAVNNAKAYEEFYAGRVGGGGSELYTAAAIMVWSDSNMHTRNTFSENCRTSGKVDAVRIKKEAFYSLQAVQSDEPKIHIVGHWNYPQLTADNYWYSEKVWDEGLGYWKETGTKLQRDPHKKTVYVIGSPDVKKVEIYINGELAGTDMKPDNTFVYAFNEIDVTQSGEISAKAYDDRDIVIAEDVIKTAGAPATIRLTPKTGPMGLIADGSDVAYFDVEVVDEEGNVCPLNYDRIDLSVSGEGVLLGGYNSGVGDKITTGKDYVFAECGVNRVFVKSTRNAGNVTLTASMDGLGSVTSTIPTKEFVNSVGEAEGLSLQMQKAYGGNPIIPDFEQPVEPFKALASSVKADFSAEGNTKIVEIIDKTEYFKVTVNGTEVTFDESAYRPIGSEIVSEVVPVLDALKAAGANITYTYQKEGEKPAYVTAGDLPVVSITGGLKDTTIETGSALTQIDVANGYTTVILNQGEAQNLMDAMAETTKAGELKAELKVMLGYLEGVTFTRNDETKTYEITYTAPQAEAALSSANVERASSKKAVLLDEASTAITMSLENDVVTINAGDSLYDAQLIFAIYNEDGSLANINVSQTVDAIAGDVKTVNVPAEIVAEEKSYKVMLWDSLQGMKPICENVDKVCYEVVQYKENFNSNTQTDGPDGTGYMTTTAETAVFSGMGTVLAAESIISLDFKFDADTSSMFVKNNKGKWGPNFTIADGQFRTQTASSKWQTLGACTVGEWYAMEIEGKIGVVGAGATFRLYKYTDGVKTLVQETPGLNLRQLGSNSNGYADNMYASAGVSVDNVKVTSLYADAVSVSALSEDISANESVSLTALATRNGAAVTVPTFAWSLYDTNGKPLTDETISISETGMIFTTAQTQTQTIVARATAQTQGNPYGEIRINITAIDTSGDTFDTITLSADKDYVRLNENTTITPTATKNGEAVELKADDISWSVYNAANIREVKNVGIKVENGVVSVTEDVLPQTITIRATNKSGGVSASIPLAIKAGNMIYDGEMGNFDTYISGDVCEEIISGITLEEGSWDGTGYYKLTGSKDLPGFAGNTTDHVLYSADMRFDQAGAGWELRDTAKGKYGLNVTYNGTQIGIVKDSKTTEYYLDVDSTSWYNIQIMCSTGNAQAYAHLIVYKYVDGKRVNPVTGEENVPFAQLYVPMRNFGESAGAFMEAKAGTSIDNVYCVKTTPDALTASVDKDTMFAGQSVQATVTATRKTVPFGYISSDLVKWVIYDENNEKPLDTDMITVDPSGKMTVDALADSQSVYLRVSTIDGLLYDSVKVDITSSDIFTVNTIGFADDTYKIIAALDVTKNFYYADDVTFIAAVYDSTETTLKSVTSKKLSGKDIAMGETSVNVGIALPEDFDKDSDVLYIYTVTSVNENTAITKVENTISGAFDGNVINITTKPAFDESSKVIVMVLKPGADTASVKDADIAYIKEYVGSDVANITSITLPETTTGDYIVEMAGKVEGVATLNTGVVTK